MRLIEADQVATPVTAVRERPQTSSTASSWTRSATRRPTTSCGSTRATIESTWQTEFDRIAAEAVIHWFRADRPGQHRGLPEITPALPLFAQLRRYTLAVIGAAETAADFAAVLFTDAPADGEAGRSSRWT